MTQCFIKTNCYYEALFYFLFLCVITTWFDFFLISALHLSKFRFFITFFFFFFIFYYPYLVNKVLLLRQIFEVEISMELHVFRSLESENLILGVGLCVCVCVFICYQYNSKTKLESRGCPVGTVLSFEP